MTFSLREFIKNGFLKAVGNQPDYWIILNAAGYMDKGVLTEGDLAEIQATIDKKNTPTINTDTESNDVDADEPEPAI